MLKNTAWLEIAPEQPGSRRLGFFKQYASWGLEEGMVEATVLRVISDVALVRQQKLAPKALSQAEVRRLLKEVELRAGVRDQAIIYTLLYNQWCKS